MSQLSKLVDVLFRGEQALRAFRKLQGDEEEE